MTKDGLISRQSETHDKRTETHACDSISRQAVLEYIDKMPSELTIDGRRVIRRRTLEEYISDTLPPVTPQPRAGEWNTFELFQSGIKETWYECPKCKWSNALLIPRNYCPNCGCRMVEPKESEE